MNLNYEFDIKWQDDFPTKVTITLDLTPSRKKVVSGDSKKRNN